MQTSAPGLTVLQPSWLHAIAAVLLCAACHPERPQVRVSLGELPTKIDALYGRALAESLLETPASERLEEEEPALTRIDSYDHSFTMSSPLPIEGTGIAELYGMQEGCTVAHGSATFSVENADSQVHIQLVPVPPEEVRCRLSFASADEVPKGWRVESAPGHSSPIGIIDSPEQKDWDLLVPAHEDIQLTLKSDPMLPAGLSVQCLADEDVAVTPLSGLGICAVRIAKPATVRLALGMPLPRLDVTMVGQPLGSRILSTPAGIDCPGHCQALFSHSSVQLELVATDSRSYFVDWSEESCGSAASCSLSVASGGTALQARFAPRVCPTPGMCWENPLPQGNDLTAVHGRAPESVWAVGKQGTILAFDGVVWSLEPSGTTADLNAVYATENPGEAWAVGASGTILYRSPASGSWQPIPSGTQAELRSVFAKHGSTLAVGAEGTLCNLSVPRSMTPCASQVGDPANRPTLIGLWFEQSSAPWVLSDRGELWFIPTSISAPSNLPASRKAKALVGWSAPSCSEGDAVTAHAIDSDGSLYSWDAVAKQWVALPKCAVAPLSGHEVIGAFSQGKELYALGLSAGTLYSLHHLQPMSPGGSAGFLWATLPAQLSPAANAGWLSAENGWLVGNQGSIQELRLDGDTLASWVPGQYYGLLRSIHGLKRESLISVGGSALLRRSEQTGRWTQEQSQAAAQEIVREVAPGKYWLGGTRGLLYRLDGQDWQQFDLQDKTAIIRRLWSRPYMADQPEAPLWGETDKLQLFYKPLSFGEQFTRNPMWSGAGINSAMTGRFVRGEINGDIIYVLGTNNDIYQTLPPDYNIVEGKVCISQKDIGFNPIDLWAMPEMDVMFISGDAGRLLYVKGCSARFIIPLNTNLETTDAVLRVTSSPSHYVGVGQHGLVLEGHIDNNGPMSDTSELMRITNGDLADIYILSDQDAYMVGSGGSIISYHLE